MKLLDSVIDWMSKIAGDTESEHSGKFAPILLAGFLILTMSTLLISA
jgi:hypothetical protein